MTISRKKLGLIAVLSLVLLVTGALAAYVILTRSETDSGTVLRAVEKHMVLPADEEPAILTIVDKTQVSSAFLKKAINGDKVLVYQNAQRAIIYRPSIDRIIDVGPVVIDDIEKK